MYPVGWLFCKLKRLAMLHQQRTHCCRATTAQCCGRQLAAAGHVHVAYGFFDDGNGKEGDAEFVDAETEKQRRGERIAGDLSTE